MKNFKKLTALALSLAISVGLVSSCGEKKVASQIPTLNWYLFFKEQADLELVEAEMNKITEREIGCHINIVRIEEGDYNEKIQLALAGGEQVDLCNMAPRLNFYSHVSKGAFLPLDEVIAEHAPETYDIMPAEFWDSAKVNGQLYGIPNYQIVGRQNGFVVLKSLLDKYNFDLSTVNTLEDMEPFFAAVRAGENANIQLFGCDGSAAYTRGLNHYIGFDTVGSESYPCVVRDGDESLTVVNQYETEEFENFCKLMREWYLKGYIPKQGAADGTIDLLQEGMIVASFDNIAPGYTANFEKQRGDRAVETVIIDPPFINTANIIATMTCIGARTQYPDLCVKFMSLINRNVDNIYNILCYGIEGKHYNKIGENRIEKIKDSGYDPDKSWEFGNNFNAYLYGTQEDDLWEQTRAINENAKVSKLLGFSFNVDPVKTEVSSCASIVSEYIDALTTGAVDPEVVLPEFRSKLKSAGADKIIEAAQEQINEWKLTK